MSAFLPTRMNQAWVLVAMDKAVPGMQPDTLTSAFRLRRAHVHGLRIHHTILKSLPVTELDTTPLSW